MTRKYRIVKDDYCGFEVQHKVWWWPWWTQTRHNGPVNSFTTVEKAELWVKEGCKNNPPEPEVVVVKYL